METTVATLAQLIDGNIDGSPDISIAGVAFIEDAKPGDVVLAANAKYFERALQSNAACIVAGFDCDNIHDGKAVIKVAQPDEAFVKVLSFFRGEESLPEIGVGVGTVLESGVSLGKDVAIGPNCYIGRGASLGDGCVLFPNVYIGDGVQIGNGTKIYPGVTVYANCTIGNRVILHAGVVIGADGFGYASGREGLMKLPHAGTVVIEDDVEIGANSAVDRAKAGATVVGRGTKIDNLVHIAHNVKVGSNCVIVALSGVAGSVEIGDCVTLAAQTGVADHVKIGNGSMVAARAGVIGDLASGSIVSGFPARDHRTEKRVQAARLHLPEIMQRLKALEAEVEELRRQRDE